MLNVSFPGIDSEALMLALRDKIAISNGSACTSSSYNPSHVLVAMGVPPSRVDEAIRLSYGHKLELNRAQFGREVLSQFPQDPIAPE